jgi:CHAT domain-containing protein
VHFQRLDIPQRELRVMALAVQGPLAASSSVVTFRRACERLYDALIRPLETHMGDVRTLAIVPDGVLHLVPFAALSKAPAGPFLAQRYRVALAPSASTFVAGPRRQMGDGLAAHVLVVGNPAAGGEELPALEAAEREARTIAAEYSNPVLLLRGEATRHRFFDALPAAQVMHFAGHAIASEEFPWLSRLVLAESEGSTGSAVFAHEIREDDLGHLRLAVLAACRSGAGAVPRGEGVLNLARPFIVAGVPFVVISLWDIDDAVASEVFTRFHRAFARSSDAVGALTEAQRALIASGDERLADPRAWAGYAVIAGMGAGRVMSD